MPAAHLLLCSPVPNGPWTGTGPWPGAGGGGGLGTPALKDLRQSRNTWGRSNHKPQRKIFLQPGRWGAGDTDGAVTKPFAHDMTNSGLSSWIQVVIEK